MASLYGTQLTVDCIPSDPRGFVDTLNQIGLAPDAVTRAEGGIEGEVELAGELCSLNLGIEFMTTPTAVRDSASHRGWSWSICGISHLGLQFYLFKHDEDTDLSQFDDELHFVPWANILSIRLR